jgi:tetratricopeptide (TPR) repeat protein
MVDEPFDAEADIESPGSPGVGGIDWALLGASRKKANHFLDRQSRYLELQMEDLHEQRDLTLSHLKLRRISDWMRVGWQSLAAVVLIAIVTVIVIAIIHASQAHDLVIDPFTVPPDLASQGIGGEQAANAFSARLNQISTGSSFYAQQGETYREADSSSVRVVIPQTGVSIDELNQYLRSLLGHETHLSGQIVHQDKGLALFLREGISGMTVTEPDRDFGKLIQKGAEAVFAADRPLRYVEYLRLNNRVDEALSRVVFLAQSGPPEQRAIALDNWSVLLGSRGDFQGATAKLQASIALDPSNPLPFVYLGSLHLLQEQFALDHLETALRLWTPKRLEPLGPLQARGTVLELQGLVSGLKGDFAGAAAANRTERDFASYDGEDEGLPLEVVWDISAHDIPAARLAAAVQSNDPGLALWQEAHIAYVVGDWNRAALLSARANAASPQQLRLSQQGNGVYEDWAVALARLGNARDADARLAEIQLPDCDLCDIARGQVAAAEGDMQRANIFFRAVADRSPGVPYASVAWGEALLRHGDLDAAIAKLEASHRIGPRMPDALELWGEALIAENRSDLALTKFEEAAHYAPNWGRLHLKWGEALLWLGRTDEARRQFDLAAGLDLSPSDHAQLRAVRRRV